METKSCKACGTPKALEEFPKNGFQPNGKPKYKAYCSQCLNTKRKQKHYEKITEILAEAGQVPACVMCGYNKNWSALCFHHMDADEKDFEINKAKTFSKARLRIEIEKCALLCHNCHMEVHYPQNEIVVDDD